MEEVKKVQKLQWAEREKRDWDNEEEKPHELEGQMREVEGNRMTEGDKQAEGREPASAQEVWK